MMKPKWLHWFYTIYKKDSTENRLSFFIWIYLFLKRCTFTKSPFNYIIRIIQHVNGIFKCFLHWKYTFLHIFYPFAKVHFLEVFRCKSTLLQKCIVIFEWRKAQWSTEQSLQKQQHLHLFLPLYFPCFQQRYLPKMSV